MQKRRFAFAILTLLICTQMSPLVFAQGSTNYRIPSDVQGAGGGDEAKSSNYMLLDTIGEPNIGPSRATNYDVNAGYRQIENGTFISLNCTPIVSLGTITGNGQNTNDGTCTVVTDAAAGYSLQWTAGPARQKLASYWSLDETSGSSAYDLSGNGNTGTHNGSPTISTVVPTNYISTRSVSFDGSDDNIYVSSSPATQFSGAVPITLSTWVYPTQNSTYGTFLVKGRDSDDIATNYALRQGVAGKKLEFYFNDSGSSTWQVWSSSSDIFTSTSTWYHVGVRYVFGSGASLIAYVNGQAVPGSWTGGTGNVTGDVDAQPLTIGWKNNVTGGHEAFTGRIDDVRIYQRYLEPEEIRDLASPYPPGSLVTTNLISYIAPYNLTFTGSLVGHYRLDDMVGTVAADASRFDLDATLTNGPVYATDVPSAINSRTYRSVLFDGTDDYIVTPNMNGRFTNDDVTISVWFYPTAGGVVITELGQVTPNASWHDSQIEVLSTGEVRVRVWNLSSVSLGTANMNAWNHAVVRYRDSTDILDGFLNGVQSGTVSGNRQTPFVDGGTQLYYAFGALDSTNTGDGTYFNGKIDDVRIYNAALSDAQIQSLYGLPQAWSVASTESAFGARLRSSSTDTDAKWGTDGGSSKWLNIGDGSLPLVTRSTRTSVSGSTEIIQFRAEVGSTAVQVAGSYTSTVMFTAVGL